MLDRILFLHHAYNALTTQLRDQRKVIDDMQDELGKTEKDNVKKDELLIVLAAKLRAEQQAHALQVCYSDRCPCLYSTLLCSTLLYYGSPLFCNCDAYKSPIDRLKGKCL